MLNILTDDADTERIVHSFVEEVPVKLYDVWMVLRFEKLDGFFLYNTQIRQFEFKDTAKIVKTYSQDDFKSVSSIFHMEWNTQRAGGGRRLHL